MHFLWSWLIPGLKNNFIWNSLRSCIFCFNFLIIKYIINYEISLFLFINLYTLFFFFKNITHFSWFRIALSIFFWIFSSCDNSVYRREFLYFRLFIFQFMFEANIWFKGILLKIKVQKMFKLKEFYFILHFYSIDYLNDISNI